jgi:CheY-like chemotaxis protein
VRLLIAEDDRVTARRLSGLATSWGDQVDATGDSCDAAVRLCDEPPPDLARVNSVRDALEPGASVSNPL